MRFLSVLNWLVSLSDRDIDAFALKVIQRCIRYASCFGGLDGGQRFGVGARNSYGQAPALYDAAQKQANCRAQVQSAGPEHGCGIAFQLWLYPGTHVNSHHDQLLNMFKFVATL
jgi:hypothetical protein